MLSIIILKFIHCISNHLYQFFFALRLQKTVRNTCNNNVSHLVPDHIHLHSFYLFFNLMINFSLATYIFIKILYPRVHVMLTLEKVHHWQFADTCVIIMFKNFYNFCGFWFWWCRTTFLIF